jgi:phage repressor protein C with HTH and peptisase S24 domain
MNIVTIRFLECYRQLRQDNRVRSGRQFATTLDYLPQGFSEIVNGRRDVTVELLLKAVERFQFSPTFLLTGEEPRFLSESSPFSVRTLAVLADTGSSGFPPIAYVPLSAQAEYVAQPGEPEFLSTLPTITLPDRRLQNLHLRVFDMLGDNMEPTILEGDKVLASYVHPTEWERSLSDHGVYVVVTPAGVLVRRVVNKIREKGYIELWSDNTIYDPFSAHLPELLEIWKVQQRFTSFLQHPSNRRPTFGEDLRELKQTLTWQSHMIEQLAERLAMRMPNTKIT